MRYGLGAFAIPAGVFTAVRSVQNSQPVERDAQGRVIWREGGAPIPVAQLEEIGVTATRDYLPAMIAGLLFLYAVTDRKKGRR